MVYPHNHAINLAYDALNRLSTMVDGVGSTVYSYDAVGQILSEDGSWADDTVSYVYTNRLRASLSVLQGNASPWVQGYGYDAAKRLKALTPPAGTFNCAYTSAGGIPSPAALVQQVTLPGGASITNTFDNVARMPTTSIRPCRGDARRDPARARATDSRDRFVLYRASARLVLLLTFLCCAGCEYLRPNEPYGIPANLRIDPNLPGNSRDYGIGPG